MDDFGARRTVRLAILDGRAFVAAESPRASRCGHQAILLQLAIAFETEIDDPDFDALARVTRTFGPSRSAPFVAGRSAGGDSERGASAINRCNSASFWAAA
jgi:hypothetical protein